MANPNWLAFPDFKKVPSSFFGVKSRSAWFGVFFLHSPADCFPSLSAPLSAAALAMMAVQSGIEHRLVTLDLLRLERQLQAQTDSIAAGGPFVFVTA